MTQARSSRSFGPATSEADVFIQWKGTDLCMDFHCPCGTHGHIDDDFAYFVRCPACDSTFQLGTQVIVRRAEPDQYHTAIDLDIDDEDEL